MAKNLIIYPAKGDTVKQITVGGETLTAVNITSNLSAESDFADVLNSMTPVTPEAIVTFTASHNSEIHLSDEKQILSASGEVYMKVTNID